jgi:ABC-2 type transport system ATP-binding protein
LSLKLAVEARGLRKSFVSGWFTKRKKEALKGVDLNIPEGAFWGILGPNGAGKTTLLSVISNLLTPDEGEILVLGRDLRTHGAEISKHINLSSGHANFLWSMTVRENLKYYGMLYGLAGARLDHKVEELLDQFELHGVAGVRFEELSTGTKQKLALSKSLINDPKLLLLDEPTVGLDPQVARRVRELIQRLHQEKGTTILMTTHNMREAEILCEEIAFIKDGKIRAFGTPQELKRSLSLGDSIHLTFQGVLPLLLLETMNGIYGLQVRDSSCHILVDDYRERLPHILDLFISQSVLIHDLSIQETNLEDVFIAFAG